MATDQAPVAALGRVVAELRRAAGLSQARLGERAGLDRTYIGSVERGERNLSWSSLSRIASALDVRVSEVVEAAEKLSARDSLSKATASRS